MHQRRTIARQVSAESCYNLIGWIFEIRTKSWWWYGSCRTSLAESMGHSGRIVHIDIRRRFTVSLQYGWRWLCCKQLSLMIKCVCRCTTTVAIDSERRCDSNVTSIQSSNEK
jgi:hypothetical protein